MTARILQPPRMLSVLETARALGLCSKTVRRLIGRGELPVHRLGRSLRISEDDLRRYLSQARE